MKTGDEGHMHIEHEVTDPISGIESVLKGERDQCLTRCPVHKGCSTGTLEVRRSSGEVHYHCVCGCQEETIARWVLENIPMQTKEQGDSFPMVLM